MSHAMNIFALNAYEILKRIVLFERLHILSIYIQPH